MRNLALRLACLLALTSAALTASAALAAPTLTEYPLTTPDRGPNGVALGAEGDVWFAETVGPGAIGRITQAGEITEFTTGLTGGSQPTGIARGQEGDLWFTEFANPGRIGKITPSGTITEYPTTTSNTQPDGIALGPEGNLWFTEAANPGRIGKITPSGSITEYPTPTTNSQPDGITQGPDGNMWFTESGGNGAIGRITPAGSITEFTKGLTAKSQPGGIAAGPDGSLWFTETAGPGRIGRITVGGTITEFSSGLSANSEPLGITAGSDGAMYFTEYKNPGQIGRVTTSGAITQTATTTGNSQPQGIVTGGDGNLWYSEAGNHGKIGVLTVAPGVGAGAATSTERTAVLKALISPDSQASTYYFEYGPTSEYGSRTSTASAGSGASLAPVAASIGSLEEGSTYHYRVVATNASGTTYGADQTFATAEAPGAQTLPAGAVTLTSAALNGSVVPHDQPTTYYFEYGPTTAYGHEVPSGGSEAGSDGSTHELSATVEGLTPDLPYHFRIVATNCGGCAEGTTYGPDATFTTATPPAAATLAATDVSSSGATLNGSVDPLGATTSYWFEYGETASYGSRGAVTTIAGTGGEQAVTAALSSLQPGTVHHYRLVASNCQGCVAGTTYGSDRTFVTEPLTLGTILLPGSGVARPLVKPPAIGTIALVKIVSGTVTVRGPGGGTISLQGPADIPIGSRSTRAMGHSNCRPRSTLAVTRRPRPCGAGSSPSDSRARAPA